MVRGDGGFDGRWFRWRGEGDGGVVGGGGGGEGDGGGEVQQHPCHDMRMSRARPHGKHSVRSDRSVTLISKLASKILKTHSEMVSALMTEWHSTRQVVLYP